MSALAKLTVEKPKAAKTSGKAAAPATRGLKKPAARTAKAKA
jgi:hypothetical protein